MSAVTIFFRRVTSACSTATSCAGFTPVDSGMAVIGQATYGNPGKCLVHMNTTELFPIGAESNGIVAFQDFPNCFLLLAVGDLDVAQNAVAPKSHFNRPDVFAQMIKGL